jgi:hypothetical protein
MTSKRLLWHTLLAVALALTVGACDGAEKTSDPGFAGHWTSTQWGEHYIKVEGSTMKVVYTHDDGRAVGSIDGTTFTGWWTEAPSRQPRADAGDVVFTFSRVGDRPAIDGTWRYGSTGTMLDNWDLTWVGTDIPADVAAKFADPAAFVRQP